LKITKEGKKGNGEQKKERKGTGNKRRKERERRKIREVSTLK
jgi:hypothetical protein